MAWSSIAGQHRVQDILQSLYKSGRLPHAMLFHGPEGSGKSAIALELAKVLNCEREVWNACDSCPSCLSMRKLQHPRLKLIFPLPSKGDEQGSYDKLSDAELAVVEEELQAKAANSYHRIAIPSAQGIKISSIRELRHESSMRGASKGKTVAILLDAHTMNSSAANALLKTLEEPGRDLMLILTSSRKESLLPTIVSRCQVLRFEPLTEQEVEEHLLRTTESRPEDIRTIVRICDGNLTQAHDLLAQDIQAPRTLVLEFLRAAIAQDPRKLMACIQPLTAPDRRQELLLLLRMLQSWFLDVLALQNGVSNGLRNIDLMDSLEKFARHYPDVECAQIVMEIDRTVDLLGKNAHLGLALIVLAQRIRSSIVHHIA